MRKGGGKQKGSQFEREICVRLSRWVSGGSQEDCFWRSAMSGGRSTVAARKGKRLAAQGGDISCIHPIGQPFADLFMAECKFYADLDFTGLLTGRGKIVQFWKTAHKEANRLEKLPFLIAKQNRMPVFVCVSKAGLGRLDLNPVTAILHSSPLDLYILNADTFFSVCRPPV